MKMKGGGKRGLMGDDHDYDVDEKKSSKKYEKSYFDVLGICCSSEVSLIEKLLKPLEGVHHVSVIVPSRTVIVLHDSLLISQLQIVKALNQARLEANVRVKGESKYQKKWPSPFAVACGVLLLLSFLKYAYPPFRWLAVAAVVVGIPPIILKGIAAIRNFRLDINILMLIAVAGSIVLNDYWEAGTIVFLFTIAEWLESRASHKATAVMLSLMNIAPQRAVLAATGVEVDAGEVMVNTILAVKAGDIIPIDGIVVDGKCEVDEKTLTGESFPVVKQLESSVWAGTINLNGYISVKTTALAEDCVVARMAKLVEEAQNNKSKTQRFIDKCAIYYTPAVVIVSGCLAIIPAALRLHNRNEWYHLALVVLVSACPCALILSTPIATFCALSKAATLGLLIKGAEYLETLAKIRVVAFDKTGTITRGEFVVSDFHSLMESVSLGELLYWVSSIESKSSHPMAAAVVDYAHTHSIEPKPDKVEEFQNFPGEGIYGKIDGKDIFVGNRKIAIRAGCLAVPTLEGETNEGKSTGYIFLGSSAAGIFSLTDVCRTGVAEALKELKTLGIKTAMLTGDCPAAARHAQDQLEGALEAVHAELLPQDKARIIKEFQNEFPTAMVGDGINDAPALATADIGISMGVSGSALATETGHIVLMSNDIRKIPKAVRLARKTRRKIIENVMLSITTKAGIIGLAIAGHPLVWAAVLADVGTCLLVIFNSMLLLRGTPAYGRKHCSTSHAHKHGCKPNHSHSHSHSHKHCSSVSKVKSQCKPQTCSSKMCAPSSCESKKSCSDSKIKGSCCESDPFTSVSHGNYKHGCCESDVPVSASPGHNKCSDSKSIHGCCESNKKCLDSKKKDSCCETVPFTSVSHGNNKRGCCESDLPVSVSPGHNNCLDSKNMHGFCGSHTTISASHGDKMYSDSENTHSCCDPGPLVAASCGKKCLDSEIKHAHCESPLVSAAVGGKKGLDSENKHGCCVNADQVKEAKDHGSSSDMITLDFGEHTVSSNHGCATHSNQSSCSEKKHGCCAHADHVIEAKHSHHGSNCDITTLDFIEHAISSTHGCAVHPKQSSCSEKKHVHDKSDQETLSCHGFDEAKHCGHGSESTVDHGTGSCNVYNHSLSTLELCHDVAKSNKHCHHAKEYITEEELNNMVRTCCNYYSSNQDVHSECMNHGLGHGPRTHGCMSLGKRHVDGCCESFRKECCGKNPHFGLGGLSEIVIE